MAPPMNSAVQQNGLITPMGSRTQTMSSLDMQNGLASPEQRPLMDSPMTTKAGSRTLGGLSVEDRIKNDPQFARALAVALQQQQQQQEQALQPAADPATPPPTSIPNANAGPVAQAQTVHKPRGHKFGKVTIKGKNVKVQQGNVLGPNIDPNLVRDHIYGEVEIEEEAEAPNLNQGELDHKGYRIFMNSGGKDEIKE